ncbi:endonuclease/exonuclease/phosphatase family protein [Agrococcus sp. ProA11]|uniref:endonuclease/exonuclease/phosphatase family protein n=1 Tax=Agrococcus chionoecetis TaxID=3153752 RepID=UPI00326175E9
MRLVTWNVLHGRTMGDAHVDADRFADAVRALDADVLALQEVDRGQPRSDSIDLTALAAEAMGGASACFVPTLIGDPARSWRPADNRDLDAVADGYGIALLSRYPVQRWHVLRLAPGGARRMPPVDPETGMAHRLSEEPRAAVAATIRSPLGVFTIVCTHLSFVPGSNIRQLRRVMRWMHGLPGPRILMGDLNLPHTVVRRLTRAHALAHGATFPVMQPMVQIDHILSPDPLPPVRQIRLARPPLSDHLPLAVELGRGAVHRRGRQWEHATADGADTEGASSTAGAGWES